MKLLLAKNFKKHKMNSMMINLFNKCEINDECRASGASLIEYQILSNKGDVTTELDIVEPKPSFNL